MKKKKILDWGRCIKTRQDGRSWFSKQWKTDKNTNYALYSNFIVNNQIIQDTQLWAARRYIHFMTIRSEGKVRLTFSCNIAQSGYQPLFYPLQRTNDGPILGWWKMYSNTLPWKCNWSCSGFGRGQKKHKIRLYFHVHKYVQIRYKELLGRLDSTTFLEECCGQGGLGEDVLAKSS